MTVPGRTTFLLMTTLLLAPAMPAVGADTATAGLAACRAEVEQYLGREVELSIVSQRRTSRGTQVKLAAHLDDHNSQFLVCWLSENDSAASAGGGTALAARIELPGAVR